MTPETEEQHQREEDARAAHALRLRIERNRPLGYFEENLAACYRQAVRRLLLWMDPLAGRRILDPLPGSGALARRLGRAGAVSFAVSARWPAHGAPADFRTVVADDPLAPFGPGALHDVVLWEPPTWVEQARRNADLRALECLELEKVFLALRLETAWSRLAGAAAGLLPTHDPTQVLRHAHLETSYRLFRQHTVRRRNSVLQLIELRRADLQ